METVKWLCKFLENYLQARQGGTIQERAPPLEADHCQTKGSADRRQSARRQREREDRAGPRASGTSVHSLHWTHHTQCWTTSGMKLTTYVSAEKYKEPLL